MTFLAEDDNLWGQECGMWSKITLVVLLLDAFLELEHHRTGGIDDLNVVTTGELIGLWRLTMGTQQDFHIVKFTQVVVVDGDESQILQPLALHAVVNDVS